jgi:hypothetical protein
MIDVEHLNSRKEAVLGKMRPALFWDVTQRRVVILYRRFGTIYWFYLQGWGGRRDVLILEDGPDRLSWNVGTELSLCAA